MAADRQAPMPAKRKSRWRLGLLVLLALVLGLVALVRIGAVLPQGQHLVEQALNGRQIGRLGRLQIMGLRGDVWGNFSIERLTLSDTQGIWLEARSVTLSWRNLNLIGRHLQIDRLGVGHLTVQRRPLLGPKKPQRPMPISLRIGLLRARVELAPAFSYRRGNEFVALCDLGFIRKESLNRIVREFRCHEESSLSPEEFVMAYISTAA